MKNARRGGYHLAFGAAAVLLTGSYVALTGRSAIASEAPGGSPSFTSSATFGVPRATGNGKHSISMLSPAQVSSWIRENEESYLVERGKGVVRYDVSQLASNNPIEDDRSERTVQVPILTGGDERVSSDWMFWGVYDGHSGWTTSTKLRESLITYVLNELDKVYKRSSPNSSYRLVPSPETIDQAIQQGFLSLDDEIVNKSIDKLLRGNSTKAGATELIAPALSGSCALLAFYDSNSRDMRVAVAGDSRAVLGSRDENGNWTARALSTDQTGSNEDEAARVRAEHPGEEATAIRHGRVLGSLEPTRSFGDARYKWTRDIQNRVSQAFFGRRTPQELKTPPYVTAKPVVTTTKVSPEKGDFMVIGSDGLFELLSNEEVVNLVAQWMRVRQPDMFSATTSPQGSPSVWSKLFGSRKDPNAIHVEDVSNNKDSMKQPIRRRAGAVPHFTVEDENCATHLIRNALGGADQEQVSMLVSIPSPLARNYRDDLTVTVVFFGEGDTEPNDNGAVKVNQAATRNNLRTKSKL
ncbi:[Pyruvate dehydrogenase [acetyl-transferring]]-phosphatase 1, mitochondrial [Trichomonascus vanleenenianus]|uniref:type 2C protein phosphatase PTC5 n=1 Tax=Trichomonascus vanleenenianus TaxID=2268995 RepID=UPI003ECAAE60